MLLVVSYQLLFNHWSIVEILLVLVSFIDIILVDVVLSFMNLFLFLMLVAPPLDILTGCLPFFRFSKEFYFNSFFLRTAKLWNSLPGECFSLTFNLSRFKANVNRHLKSLSKILLSLSLNFPFIYVRINICIYIYIYICMYYFCL